MTLYYSLVFLLLVTEMLLFVLLIVPLPFTWRRKLFTFISESPLIAKLQYGLKITFIFILILFIDSVNRVYRVQVEMSAFSGDNNAAARAAMVGTERMEVQARKFYSQRNMYLCGFTLFLSLILNRTYVLILDVLRLEENVKRLEGDPAVKGDKARVLANAGTSDEITKLQEELKSKEKDLQAMKAQSEGLQREYSSLADKYGETQKDLTPKKDK